MTTVQGTNPETGEPVQIRIIRGKDGTLHFQEISRRNTDPELLSPAQLEQRAAFVSAASKSYGKRVAPGDVAGWRELKQELGGATFRAHPDPNWRFKPERIARQQQLRSMIDPDVLEQLADLEQRGVRSIPTLVPRKKPKYAPAGTLAWERGATGRRPEIPSLRI